MTTKTIPNTSNLNDRLSVLIGAVHNVGAGGVSKFGNISGTVSAARYAQYCRRTSRATGYRD